MSLVQLPPSTVKLIGSSQVITSVSSVVKELMENSLDSGAQAIEVKLEKHGLEKIEVKDDGCGIGKNDALLICIRSYTSKISSFSDLDCLSSYGFRGEALSSLCSVAQVSVITKPLDDDIATHYTYDQNGQVVCSKVSHITKGTIVTITELFKNLPVRKQCMSNSKKAGEELKKVEKVVKSLAMVHPRVRVYLIHNKFLIWQKTSVANLRQSVMQIFSLSMVKQLHHALHNTQQIRLEMMVPKHDCDIASISASSICEAFYLFVNQRPIRCKEVEKLVYNKLNEYFDVFLPANKYPICVVALTVPAGCLDVNLEPNKTHVFFKNQDEVLDIINQGLHLYYTEKHNEIVEQVVESNKVGKKRKIENDNLDLETKKVILDRNKTSEAGFEKECSIVDVDIPEIFGEGSSSRPNSSLLDGADNLFEKFCIDRANNPEVQENYKPLINEVPTNTIADPCPNNNSLLSHISSTDSKIVPESKKITSNISNKSFTRTSISGQPSLLDFIKKERTNGDLDVNFSATDSGSNVPLISEINDTVCSQEETIRKSLVEFDDIKMYDSTKTRNNNAEHVVTTSPTLSQWSRGELTTDSGDVIKGACIQKSNAQPTNSQESQTLSNRSVSSQMGCKEMSGFTKFARKMRKEILEENPKMSFIRVAQLLQIKWRKLNDAEKKKYQETVSIITCSNSKDETIKNHDAKPKNKEVFTRRADIELEVNMDSLKELVNLTVREDNPNMKLIAQLESSPLWLCASSVSDISVISVIRLLEAVMFDQYMENFNVPAKMLENFIKISPSVLTDSEWKLLKSLDRSPNGNIKDPRLISNGFIVEIVEGEEEGQVLYVPENISFIDVEMIQEILGLIICQGIEVTLKDCRPLRVRAFIRSEVMRDCSKAGPPNNQKHVQELLSYWLKNLASHSNLCIHHHPITYPLELDL